MIISPPLLYSVYMLQLIMFNAMLKSMLMPVTINQKYHVSPKKKKKRKTLYRPGLYQ